MDASDNRISNQLLIDSHQNSGQKNSQAESKLQETISQGNLAEFFSVTKTSTRIWVAEKLNIDTHQEPRGSVNALPSNITKYFRENGKYLFVSAIKRFLLCGRATITHELENYPELPILTQKGFQAICQHYKQKYGTSISSVHLNDLKSFLNGKRAELQNCAVPEYFGLIIHEDDAQTQVGHAIPVLVCLMPVNKRLECFIMDVTGISDPTGPDANKLDNRLRKELAGCHVDEVVNSDEFRQADTISCKTDALVLLRNALLSLKQTPYADGLVTNLKQVEAEIFSSLRNTLKSVSTNKATDKDLNQYVNFFLMTVGVIPENLPKAAIIPPEWAYFEQIFKSPSNGIVIRDRFSSKLEKKEHPKTIAEFRKKNQEVCTFIARLNIEIGQELYNNFKSMLERGCKPPNDLSYELIAEGNKRFVNLSIRIIKPINTYLQKKAFRNVELLRSLHLQTDKGKC